MVPLMARVEHTSTVQWGGGAAQWIFAAVQTSRELVGRLHDFLAYWTSKQVGQRPTYSGAPMPPERQVVRPEAQVLVSGFRERGPPRFFFFGRGDTQEANRVTIDRQGHSPLQRPTGWPTRHSPLQRLIGQSPLP